jgi:hypothetical protein
MGRRSQFFIIAAVIVILNLLTMSAIVRKSYLGSPERPSQEIAIAGEFNSTVVPLYSDPYSFKRNVKSFQLGIQKSSALSSQIYLTCEGQTDCSTIPVGNCVQNPCETEFKVVGPSMSVDYSFLGKMGR